MTLVFNTLTRTMIIASMMIVILVCEHVINEETSDGYTHTKGVSCILYNHLFKVVIIIFYIFYIYLYFTYIVLFQYFFSYLSANY